MSAVPNPPFLSAGEYLARERTSQVRHEYHRGEMFAMAGASRAHKIIAGNVFRVISTQLLRGPCEAYTNDMRVKISGSGYYTYPDVVVACEERQFEDAEVDTLLNPRVLVEVLSESTEAHDRGFKSTQYRGLESLREYVLIIQDGAHVEHYVRNGSEWSITDLTRPDDVLALTSIGCRTPLREIYDRLEFNPKS